jgi:uncharacterized protein (TIGR03435 family)
MGLPEMRTARFARRFRAFFACAAALTLMVCCAEPGTAALPAAQAPAQADVPAMPANADPAFEVATIKPTDTSAPHGMFFTTRGRYVIAYNIPVRTLIEYAYGVHARQIVGGPAALLDVHYDVEGVPNVAGRPNHDQSRALFRKLLESRFKLTFDRETREMPAFAIELAKGGPKLTPTTRKPGDRLMFSYTNAVVLTVRNASMADFAHGMQEAFLDKPVIDRTGLKDRYDFELKWTPDESQNNVQLPAQQRDDPNAPPGLYTAIQEQLGLKIDSTKAPVEVLAIKHIETPSEN